MHWSVLISIRVSNGQELPFSFGAFFILYFPHFFSLREPCSPRKRQQTSVSAYLVAQELATGCWPARQDPFLWHWIGDGPGWRSLSGGFALAHPTFNKSYRQWILPWPLEGQRVSRPLSFLRITPKSRQASHIDLFVTRADSTCTRRIKKIVMVTWDNGVSSWSHIKPQTPRCVRVQVQRVLLWRGRFTNAIPSLSTE